MHENRETSGAPRPERERGRFAKAQSHTANAYASEESDCAIVSMNQANNETSYFRRSLGREGRGPRRTSFNPTPTRHSAGHACSMDLSGVASCSIPRLSPRWEPYALTRSYGSVRGAISDGRPYRDPSATSAITFELPTIENPMWSVSYSLHKYYFSFAVLAASTKAATVAEPPSLR
jgi:hypothetical protein